MMLIQYLVSIVYLWISLGGIIIFAVQRYTPLRNSPLIGNLVRFGKLSSPFKGKCTVSQVPKRFFVHFYFTAAVCVPTALVASVFNNRSTFSTTIVLLVLSCQSLKRLYENLYVQIFSNSSMSLAHYFLGHFFYLTLPLCIYWSDVKSHNRSVAAVIGYLFFSVCVMFLQHLALRQLANTRKSAPKDKQSSYLLPKGSMFTYVTCPHFSLEISLYVGTHVFLGFQWIPFSPVVIFVTLNQICSGLLNHHWYEEHFPDFVKSRKALIPFVL
uniref:Polyprenal reductase n=1 Tax=Mesocestoides corti TaxID=53468 RepID=A0A5K3FCW5_MESCO